MKTWKLTLEYDGSKYSGWQEQKNARTVMGQLRTAATELFGEEVDLQGAGRTDAGVHAAAQVCHMRVGQGRDRRSRPFHPDQIMRELNDRLPADIAIREVLEVDNRFHARHDALTRTYIYQISSRKNAFSKRYVWWIKERLNVELMTEAAAMLAGRHDFICFRAQDPSRPDESTQVVVEAAEVVIDEDLILIRIEASHFLWRMVRRVVGTLVKLGKGEITIEDWVRLLQGKCDPRMDVAAWTAPAAGLFLELVRYPEPGRRPEPRKGFRR